MLLLLAFAFLLMVASRFKGESNYAALVISVITLPDYIYNVCGYMHWNDVALMMAPLAYSANLTLMPFLLLLAHRGFDPNYRFRLFGLLHFLPAVAFAILVAIHLDSMSLDEIKAFTVERSANFRSTLTAVNFITLSTQLVVYFYWIFRYLHKVKKYIFDHYTQPELSGKVWIPRFITFMGILIVVAMIASNFFPLGGFRLFYLINVLAMGFLIFQELEHSFLYRRRKMHNRNQPPGVAEEDVRAFEETMQQPEEVKDELTLLTEYSVQVEEYLKESEAYTDADLSLEKVAIATGISARNISKAINTVPKKTFFDLVNGLRIEKSKELLQQKKQQGLTLETIAEKSGFNSQYTFCRAFKKVTGVSTTEWLRLTK